MYLILAFAKGGILHKANRILIVDNDVPTGQTLQELIPIIFEGFDGVEVVHVTCPEEAIQRANGSFQVVMTDMSLKHALTGLDVIRAFRTASKETARIAMSCDQRLLGEEVSRHTDATLLKPFGLELLEKTLTDVMS